MRFSPNLARMRLRKRADNSFVIGRSDSSAGNASVCGRRPGSEGEARPNVVVMLSNREFAEVRA